MIGDRLFASGLFRGPGALPETPQSRLISFTRFTEPGFHPTAIPIPKQSGTELAHEGMAISAGQAYFLPEDLGATNRIWRLRIAELAKGAKGAVAN